MSGGPHIDRCTARSLRRRHRRLQRYWPGAARQFADHGFDVLIAGEDDGTAAADLRAATTVNVTEVATHLQQLWT